MTKSGIYPLRLTAAFIGYTHTATLDFQVTLVDTCATTTLSVDPTILSSLAIVYTIGSAPHNEILDNFKVTPSPTPLTSCPKLNYSFGD